MGPTNSETVAKLKEIREASGEFLKTHQPDCKFEAVKDDLDKLFTILISFAKMGHSDSCECAMYANICRKQLFNSPNELFVVVTQEKELLGFVGFDFLGACIGTVAPKKMSFKDLEELQVTPFDCVQFVYEGVEKSIVRRSVTQAPASA
jgi:hypothetical protein